LIGPAAEAQRKATGKALTGSRTVKRLLAVTRAALGRVERAGEWVNKNVPLIRGRITRAIARAMQLPTLRMRFQIEDASV
jgi:hypothetical protein|tara:strand:- start:6793 stop:7032 length:240 start_codon:yes stop_codon:yes gene_type:complete